MKGLDAAQADQLRQICEYLSYQREQQGISLEKISNQTYIPLRVLRALDSLQFEQLPEPVYIRGFIRRYADVLGLDGTEIADAFPVEPVVPDPLPEAVAEFPDPAQPTVYESERPERRSGRSAFPLRSLLLAGAGVAVLLGAIALAMNLFKQPAPAPEIVTSPGTELPSESPSTPTQAGSSPAPSLQAPPSVAATASPTPSVTAASTPVKADISLTGRSWMQVVADGKTAFEGTLGQGEQRSWQAQKKLVITAGNAGAVVLSCNQGAAKPLGKAGEVVDATCSVAMGRVGQPVNR
jgi:cytoskeleton protein RodZ